MRQVVVDAARTASTSPVAFIIEYALIALYGILSGWVGVATLDVVGGPVWAIVWPVGIVVFATSAIVGITLSRRTGRGGFELVTTLALIALLVGYSAAIIFRVEFDGQLNRLPVAVLPVALSVHPFSRLVKIARGTVVR